MIKTCYKCGVQEEVPNPRPRSGWRCKPCDRIVSREVRLRRIEAKNAQGKLWRANNRTKLAEISKRNPNQAARGIFRYAVQRGAVVRPLKCEKCGAGGRIVGHHPDYSKPLEVIWLCMACHGLEHRIPHPRAAKLLREGGQK